MDSLLADDHSELDSVLDELFAALDAREIEPIFQKLDLFWARLAMHIRAEHLHLFPAIFAGISSENQITAENSRAPNLATARNAIAKLREDHDFFMRELGAAIKQIRELRENNLSDEKERISLVREKISEIRRRLEQHNKLEETEVYQWVKTLLNLAELTSLNERMQKELNNLPPRFGGL